MTKTELIELIANGENSGVEFKRDDLRPEQLAKEIVALANFQGGHILLGVEDDGTVSGIQRANLEEWVMDTVFGHYVHPMILPFYEEVRIDDEHRVAVISLIQGVTKPYVVRHKGSEEIFLRVGSVSRKASREQQARLFAIGGMLHTEVLPVSGSSLDDLDLERLEDYLRNIIRDPDIPNDEESWSRRLCGMGFMNERDGGAPVCTIAGILLFGHRPRRVLRQAGVRWMAFEGSDMGSKAFDDAVLDDALVGLWRTHDGNRELDAGGVMEQLVERMTAYISEEDTQVGERLRRERHWFYPVEALREALVNAFAHRDWTRIEEIEVVSYSDRLEIKSPGAMQNSMTVEKMVAGQRSPRNTLIVEVLRDYGYVDARGMGVRTKIIPLLTSENGVPPEFEATEDYLAIKMYREPGSHG
ncbi:MAG: putative DNA binding domain-containing protein [Candidatus Thiodiazotropha lotti]|nr:putative DNA binding domain-containing protein [Candidatus Thiodiazotropha lotti]